MQINFTLGVYCCHYLSHNIVENYIYEESFFRVLIKAKKNFLITFIIVLIKLHQKLCLNYLHRPSS